MKPPIAQAYVLLLLTCAFFERVNAADAFHIKNATGYFEIEYADQPVAQYVYRDLKIHRPYFSRLHAPGGVQVTRNFPPKEAEDPPDHPFFHPGLWLAFGDMNGQDSWRNRALVRHKQFVVAPEDAPQTCSFTVENEYMEQGQAVATEICRYTLSKVPSGFFLLWDADFRPGPDPLRFRDQEEMGLGARVHTPFIVSKGGVIRNQSGQMNEAGTRGQTTDWIDFSGAVNGTAAGIALMAHPKNFRPSWAHSRDYGLIVLNPFGRQALTGGEKSEVTVEPGDHLRLRFGVFLHSGEAADLPATYRSFVEQSGD